MSAVNGVSEQQLSKLVLFALSKVHIYLATADKSLEEEDELSRFGLSAQEAARALRKADSSLFYESVVYEDGMDAVVEGWINNPPADLLGLAELYTRFMLSFEDIEIISCLAGVTVDPSVRELYGFAVSEPNMSFCAISVVCRILSNHNAEKFERYLSRFSYSENLRKHCLISVENRDNPNDAFERNLVNRRVILPDRVLEFLKFPLRVDAPVDEAVSTLSHRIIDEVDISSLHLPQYTIDSLLQLIRSQSLRLVLSGPAGSEKEKVATAFANLLGKKLLFADLSSLLSFSTFELQRRLADLFREAKLGDDFVYFNASQLPEFIVGSSQIVLESVFGREHCILGVDSMTLWMVQLTTGWPVVNIPLPSVDHRMKLWAAAFEGEKRCPDSEAVETISRRYEMSETQIRQASTEAKRLSIAARRKKVDLFDLDKACRTYFAHKLSDLADLVPPSTFKPDQLILPVSERQKFDEVLLYAEEHDTIYDDWGFSERFPYGRGLSVLFYGPPGTGKTMAASIIANYLGLDLFRIDLSRIMNRYVGETEKNLARVFDEAERGQVMLLFDEADALFSKRTQVKSTVDRYANLEVAYLLQRMENFEGVTVLTTNVEANLDDAFKRRIRYRIYFPMPDAETRARLFESLLPSSAPVKEGIDFSLLGEQFELSGGHIKQAVLRAAFYARKENSVIGLRHLTEATIAECRELGMLMNDNLPRPLTNALRVEKGLPELSEEEYNELHRPVLSPEESFRGEYQNRHGYLEPGEG